MQTKLKTILLTAVGTTIGWAVIIAGLLYLWPNSGSPALIVEYPRPGEPDSLRWQSQKGEYIIQLVSSNQTTAATSTLFTRTSRPPERIWFQTFAAPPQK